MQAASAAECAKMPYFAFLQLAFATRNCYPVAVRVKGIYQKRGWFYYQPPSIAGKRPPAIALKTKDSEEAVEKAFELHLKGSVERQSKKRMSGLVDEYLRRQVEAGVHTAKTSHSSRMVLDNLVKEWNDPLVRSIDKAKVENWRADLRKRDGIRGGKMSAATVDTYLRRLSGFFSWLVENKHIRHHPMETIRMGRVKKTRRDRFCTIEEREMLLLNPPSEEIDFILHFGFFAGLRFGEMLAMQKSWFTEKPSGMIITIQETPNWKPKDKECRTIELHPRLIEFLDRYGFREPYMLAPRKSVWREEPAYRYNPKKAFKNHATKHGMPWMSYHTLRHSFASHLAMAGATIAEIASALGDSIKVTEENYVGLLPACRSKIAAI